MSLKKGQVVGLITTFIFAMGCTNKASAQSEAKPILFQLSISKEQLAKRQASIDITVPSKFRKFEAPKWYGGAPMFLKFVTDISATDAAGAHLHCNTKDNVVEIESTNAATYTLHYTYDVPQTISGQLDFALPVLNDEYAIFDNDLTFLEPQEAASQPAKLSVSAPYGWQFETGWGADKEISISHLSDLISGMIVMGHYEYSRATVGNTKIVFAIVGDFSHELIKEEFCKVLQSQQEIAGDLPSRRLLVSFLPTTIKECKGASLTNAFTVNIPVNEKLSPFNFAVIGTTSHELFHQWNVRYLKPKKSEGAYLLTEGFTNYFAIAALVKAGLISEERFGRFLCRYRQMLEENPRYPGSDYATIQAGLEKDDHLFDLCYKKGPLVAVLLDLALREDSNNTESVASWFKKLCAKFGGTDGYEIADVRESLIKVSGKQNGQTAKTFDSAFLGGQALDLDGLFKKLGITCDSAGNCHLVEIPKDATNIRSKVFRAEN